MPFVPTDRHLKCFALSQIDTPVMKRAFILGKHTLKVLYRQTTKMSYNPTDNYKTLFLTVIQKHTLRSHRQTFGMKMAFHLDKLSMKIPSVPTDRHG